MTVGMANQLDYELILLTLQPDDDENMFRLWDFATDQPTEVGALVRDLVLEKNRLKDRTEALEIRVEQLLFSNDALYKTTLITASAMEHFEQDLRKEKDESNKHSGLCRQCGGDCGPAETSGNVWRTVSTRLITKLSVWIKGAVRNGRLSWRRSTGAPRDW